MLTTITQITAIILAGWAAFLLAKSNIFMTPEVIIKLSRPIYGHNKEIIENLSQQNGYAKVGIFVLVNSIVVQFLTLPQTGTNEQTVLTTIVVIISWIFGVSSYWIARKLEEKNIQKANECIDAILKANE